MLNTHKLIALNIIIGLLVGLSMSVNYMVDEFSTTKAKSFTNFANTGQNELGNANMGDQESIYGDVTTENPVQENRVVNGIKVGAGVLGYMLLGLIPWVFPWSSVTGNEVIVIAIMFNIFRTLLLIITALDIYFVFINKKSV